MPSLKITNLKAEVGGKRILNGVSLNIPRGEVHALMGPNGSGKSTLAFALMGHPKYRVVSGKVSLDGRDILKMPTDGRARAGIFLGFQHPLEVDGLDISSMLRTACMRNGMRETPQQFSARLMEQMRRAGIEPEFASRAINVGFSGGEKKRLEMLQLMMLNPKYAILDEMDSGLDIDSVKIVAKGINEARKKTGILLITHYKRLLEHVRPDKVHVFVDGKIALSGNAGTADKLESHGYDWVREGKDLANGGRN